MLHDRKIYTAGHIYRCTADSASLAINVDYNLGTSYNMTTVKIKPSEMQDSWYCCKPNIARYHGYNISSMPLGM